MNFDQIKKEIDNRINKIYEKYILDVQRMSNINNVYKLFTLESEKINNYCVAIEKDLKYKIQEELGNIYSKEKVQRILNNRLISPTFDPLKVNESEIIKKVSTRIHTNEEPVNENRNVYNKDIVIGAIVGIIMGASIGGIIYRKISMGLVTYLAGGAVAGTIGGKFLKNESKTKLQSQVESNSSQNIYKEILDKDLLLKILDKRKVDIRTCLFEYIDNIKNEISNLKVG